MLIKKRSLDLFPSKQLHHYRQMAAAGGGGGFGVGVISPALMHHPHPPQRNLLLLPPRLSPGNSLSMLTVKGSSTGSYHGNGFNWRGCSDHYCRSSRRDHDDDSFFRIRHYDKNYNVLEHRHHHDQGGTPPPPSTKTAPMNKLDDGAIDCLGFPYNHHRRSVPDKLVVAVDVDEVLGSFVSALNKFIADRYSSNHSVSEYHVYEFFKIWNCSRDEADVRVHEFFKTPYFKTGIHPIPGARSALHKLASFCNLSVVTSRQNAIKDHTIEWIEKHYPGLFEEIHFGNHFALDGISRPKSDICRSLGAQVLIDDNPRYAMECAEVGIRVLLFDYENSYPWCKTGSATLHPLVTKVHNWEEVEQQLVSWIISS